MTSKPATPSDYRSRQKRAGDAMRQETRQLLLDAAAQEFAARGYAATTITRLAATAGVSVQTLYLAWGSKRELLRGYMEHALAGGAASPEDAAMRFAGLSMHERLVEMADLVAEVAARAAVGWALYRDAAAVDSEIADDWNELQLLRRRLFSQVLADAPETALVGGLTVNAAADTAWAIASPESYDLLVTRVGYTLDQFRDWMRRTLVASILPLA